LLHSKQNISAELSRIETLSKQQTKENSKQKKDIIPRAVTQGAHKYPLRCLIRTCTSNRLKHNLPYQIHAAELLTLAEPCKIAAAAQLSLWIHTIQAKYIRLWHSLCFLALLIFQDFCANVLQYNSVPITGGARQLDPF
jgi:hypothetical protein